MAIKDEPQIRWNRAVKTRFIEAMLETGSAAGACRALGVARSSASLARRNDPAFDDEWTRAIVASQERILDTTWDRFHNGRVVAGTDEDGNPTEAREPLSERSELAAFNASVRTIGAYQAAREADPDADIAARRRVRIGWQKLAESLGILF